MLLCACAQTEFFDRSGNRIARFQGDMTNLEFTYSADGSITWRAATVSHSSATAAAYTGATGMIGAAAAGAAGVILSSGVNETANSVTKVLVPAVAKRP